MVKVITKGAWELKKPSNAGLREALMRIK